MKTITVISGGLDSISMLYSLAQSRGEIEALTFDYGQRHRKEISFAESAAKRLGIKWDLIDLSGLTKHIGGSSLTDNIPVPDGHYAHENMKVTVVPNRNAIMLAIAYGIAVARNASAVAIAAHAGDHYIYPDCRPLFVQSFEFMQQVAIEGFGKIELLAPFLYIAKSEIVKIGEAAGVDFGQTWSCYKGGELHCGTCGTCNERKEAFKLAEIKDPTKYLR